MKKQSIPQLKLKLHRETLRLLEEGEFTQIRGGSMAPCPSAAPPFVCPLT
jgi:hypothetical protein